MPSRMPDRLTARMTVPMSKFIGKVTMAFALQTEIARLARVMTFSPDFAAKIGAAGEDGELRIVLDIQPVPGWLLRQQQAEQEAERLRA